MPDLSLLISSLRISIPYAAGGLGGTLTERSGTVNIAIEGFMLTGAFAFACAGYYCQTTWLPEISAIHSWVPTACGLIAAVVAAAALSLFHAVATIYFRADQIVSGLATNFLALGVTDFLLQKLFGSASNSPQVPVFGSLYAVNEAHWASWINSLLHPIILLLAFVLLLSHWLLGYTRLGLRMCAVGENPLAASAAGIRSWLYRFYGILLGAGCAALGGVWLVSEQGLFSSNITAGRGYIALAAMIIGRWKPLFVAVVCLFFGFAEALQNFLQVSRQASDAMTEGSTASNLSLIGQWASAIPVQLIQALPYIFTIVVVAVFVGRSKAPSAIGRPLADE